MTQLKIFRTSYLLLILAASGSVNRLFAISLATHKVTVLWLSLSFQITMGIVIVFLLLFVYLYRLRVINKKNKVLYDLNKQLIFEVSQRKRAEKNLIASKQRFLKLSQATFEAIFITNENRISEINQSAMDMFGYKRKELIGMQISDLIVPPVKNVISDIFLENSAPLRARGVKKDKSKFSIELRGKDIDYDNKTLRVVAVTDITEKVEADKQTEVLEEQLRQAQKMEAIGNLAGGVAHDFNNMLQVIRGFSEMAVKKLENNNPATTDITQIISTTEKASHLTKQLMTLSRKQAYQPLVLDLNDLITNLENILGRLLQSDIIIQKNLQPNIPKIYADPGQVEQVLINLIVNARDAINERKNGSEKKIEITTEKVVVDDEFLATHIDMTTTDHVSVEIKDNGCGISTEIQQRIYEPFFTTKPEGKGTGLGLSTVYGIIKQNNAAIELESNLNKGSAFKIYWPATQEVIKEQPNEVVSSDNSSGNETILLVEDEEGIRNFAVLSLKQKGYNVYTAENGIKALRLIEEHNIEIDLLVSDLNMPDMDGDELVSILTKKLPKLKTLIMSGYGDEFISDNSLLKEDINFLQKPFSIKNLLQKIRTILDRN